MTQSQRQSVLASQNLRTSSENVNTSNNNSRNPGSSISTVRVGLSDPIEISSDEDDFSDPETSYHGHVASTSASPQPVGPASGARSILKRKAQTEEDLAIRKSARYGEWKPVASEIHGEDDTEISDAPATTFKEKKKQKGLHLSDTDHRKPRVTESPSRASTPRTTIRLNEGRCVASIDTGTEINFMTEDLREQLCLPMRLSPALRPISHTGHRRDFVGVCEDVDVSIGGVITKQNIFVLDSADHLLVLGTPFIIKSRARLDWTPEGNLNLTCHSSDGTRTVICRVMSRN